MFRKSDWIEEEVLHLRWFDTGRLIEQNPTGYGDINVAVQDALMFAYAEDRNVAIANQYGELITRTRFHDLPGGTS